MSFFKPSYDAGVAAIHVRSFVKEHHDVFLKILKPLLPYIAGFQLLDAVISDMYFSNSKDGFSLFGILSAYFVMALVISWHRVVIHGVQNYEPMNPFAPKKNEILFIVVGIAIPVVLTLIFLFVAFLSRNTGPLSIVMLVLLFIPIALYVFYRCSFYFPAKAVDSSMTLKQAYALSKGYLWKLIFASFLASWRVVLITWGASLVMIGVGAVFSVALPFVVAGVHHTLIFVLTLPITLYLEPLLTVLGVSVLSNYYLYAIQHSER